MWFGKKKRYFLGVDFGTSLIKAVELVLEDGKVSLSNYGQVDLARLERGELSEGNTYDDEVALYLRALMASFHPKVQSTYVAMPAFVGLVSLIEFPEMQENELSEAVKFEAHKYIPTPLEEVALSWEVTGTYADEQGQPKMEVLLVAALKKEVERYHRYVSSVNLRMDFLELETFSLTRSIVGQDAGRYLLIDIGSRTTNLILVEDGVVKMSRNLNAGGKEVTQVLVDQLHIAYGQAEELKKSTQNYLTGSVSAIVFPVFEMIKSEAVRMLRSFMTKYPDKDFQGMILSGGTAHMTGLAEYFAQSLNLPVKIGNPWQRVLYGTEVADDIARLGASFSVAIGLALAGIDALDATKKSYGQKPFSLKELLTKEL